MNNTESLGANSSSETRSVFYCPRSPGFIWDLNHTTSLKIIVAVTTIACPVTILLNLLVIIAVKMKRELKRNSNILLSSLAAADLLVGAVSMPLSITLDALVLQRFLLEDVICTIDTIVFALYSVNGVSFLHLLLIAWERYVATVKWKKYKTLLTKERLKKYAKVAWFFPLLTIAPGTIMEAVGVSYKVLLALDVTVSIFWAACVLFIIYFYVQVYFGVRKQNRTQVCSAKALNRAKRETKIAYTTFYLTLFAGISMFPAVVVYLFGELSPFLKKSFISRWADTMVLLNSLVNPLLYFYRNVQLRNAALELLRCGKPQRIQPVVRSVPRMRRRRSSVASLDIEEPDRNGQKRRCTEMDEVKERPISDPSKTENDKVFTQQCNKHVVTVQIENTPRKNRTQRNNESPKGTTKLKRFPHRMVGKIGRSTSLNENSIVTLTNCHQNAAGRNFKRSSMSRSLPILSTNLNTCIG